ncbi:unnamed protein product [Prorocentrum cordatum]|uniref:Glyoxalase/fosfomycin resistance/dioxygenase domain-containing protein n=1 Tax=Prorocentrum cordatum TaxID=2364126 RepID=A0ABN9TGL6_9DINO|nr:unnamed protein product [Polarella glacialis]
MHIRGLDHVALGVRSLPRAAAWYRALLGLEDFRPGDPAFQNEAIRMVQSPCGGAKLALLHLDDAAWALRERQLRAAIGEALRTRAAPAGAGPKEGALGHTNKCAQINLYPIVSRIFWVFVSPPRFPYLPLFSGESKMTSVFVFSSLLTRGGADRGRRPCVGRRGFVATLPARLEAGIATHAGACHGASATQPEEAAGLGGGAGRPGLGPAGDLHGAPGGADGGCSDRQHLGRAGAAGGGRASVRCFPRRPRRGARVSGSFWPHDRGRHHRACVEQQFARLFRWREYENYGPEVQQSVFFHDLDLNEVEVTFWGGRTEGFPDAAWSAEAA